MWTNERIPPLPQQLRPLRLRPNSTLFSDFSPKMYNGKADRFDAAAFSNGDGLLIYPGRHGDALPTLRLENLRDVRPPSALLLFVIPLSAPTISSPPLPPVPPVLPAPRHASFSSASARHARPRSPASHHTSD